MVRLKIFDWIKILRRHLHQILGNWTGTNFVTESRVNSRLILRMREWRDESEIYNCQRTQLSNNKFINGIWGGTLDLAWLQQIRQHKTNNLIMATSSGKSHFFIRQRMKIKMTRWIWFDLALQVLRKGEKWRDTDSELKVANTYFFKNYFTVLILRDICVLFTKRFMRVSVG